MARRILIDALEERVAASGDESALHWRDDSGWRCLTWGELLHRARLFAAGLTSLDLPAGERILLFANNSADWVIADLGIWMAACVSVPIPGFALPGQCSAWAKEVGAQVAIAGSAEECERLRGTAEGSPIRHCVLLSGSAPGAHSMDPLCEEGARLLAADPDLLARRRDLVHGGSLATIAFTSGVTGRPRAVCLSHDNLLAQMRATTLTLPLDRSDLQLIVLPFAHVFSRILYLASISVGSAFAIGRGLEHFEEDCKHLRPTFLAGVPQVFETIHSRFHVAMAGRNFGGQGALRLLRGVVEAAQPAADEGATGLGERARALLAERLLFRPLRAALGGRVRFVICGGAPISDALHALFACAGIPMLRAYGLCEHVAAVTMATADEAALPGAGRPLPGVKVRLDAQGEVQVAGPSLMMGYLPADGVVEEPPAPATADEPDSGDAHTESGTRWFSTGDVGRLEEGRLRVLGRTGDVLVREDGRSLHPESIEAELRASPWIRHAVIVGEDRPALGALLCVRKDALRETARQQRWKIRDDQPLQEHPQVYRLIEEEVERITRICSPADPIRFFAILPRGLSRRQGELTSTFKLRRAFVRSKYAPLVEELYRSAGAR